MVDYTQSFDQFASSLGPTDLALYAGVALVVWVLFKDKLNPLTQFVTYIINKLKIYVQNKPTNSPQIPVQFSNKSNNKDDVFFELVTSWKQTRDLAIRSGCDDAVKVVDQMFPYLSPNGCDKEEVKS